MAIYNPSTLYTGGQGEFDSLPYTKYAQAKQMAKESALNNYFKDLNTKVNLAGVRTQDRVDPVTGKGIDKDIEEWTKYGIENSSAIQKNTPERAEFEKRFRDIQFRIEQSKKISKDIADVGKLRYENKLEMDDDALNKLSMLDKSIYDPSHYKEHLYTKGQYQDNKGSEWSLGDFQEYIPSLNTQEKDKIFDYAARGFELEYAKDASGKPILKDFTKDYKIADLKYSDESLKNGADRMSLVVKDVPMNDEEKKVRKHYIKLKDDPTFLTEASPIFQKFYGKPIVTAADAAAADFLLNQSKVQKPSPLIPIKKDRGYGRGGDSSAFAYDYWTDLRKELDYRKSQYGSPNVLTKELPQSLFNVISSTIEKTKKQGIKPKETFVGELNGRVGLFSTAKSLKQGLKGEMLPSDEALVVYLDELGFNTVGNEGIKSKTLVKEKAAAQQPQAPPASKKSAEIQQRKAESQQGGQKKIKGTKIKLY